MLCHDYTIQVIKLYKVWVFEHELAEDRCATRLSFFQFFDSQLSTLHLTDHAPGNLDRDQEH